MHFWKKNRQNPSFLYFVLDFCEDVSFGRHRSQTLGMLVLNLVSMFRGHSKLTIGTKINIIRGSFRKYEGGGNPPPTWWFVLPKNPWWDEG